MDNQAPNPSAAAKDKADDKSEHFYDLLTVISRAEIILLMFGVLFYCVSASISWRFDVSGAQKTISITYNMLGPYEGKPLTGKTLDSLQDTLNSRLQKNHLSVVYISNFSSTAGQGLSYVQPPSPGNMSDLDDKSSWSRNRIEMLVTEYQDNYKGYNLYQFIVQGAFTSNTQIAIIQVLFVLLSLIMITNGIYYYHIIKKKREIQREQDKLRDEANKNPEASPVWELAQITLNKYYTRNLSQNNWIFYVSVAVMMAGFCLVLYGIAIAYGAPDNKLVTIVSSASGVIVQFIGATFLVIYNSTITQALQYTNSLQNVSTIGTSMKILDSIKNDETEETRKDKEYINMMITAKIKIAELLIEQSKTEQPKKK